jgi:hypothetical protein
MCSLFVFVTLHARTMSAEKQPPQKYRGKLAIFRCGSAFHKVLPLLSSDSLRNLAYHVLSIDLFCGSSMDSIATRRRTCRPPHNLTRFNFNVRIMLTNKVKPFCCPFNDVMVAHLVRGRIHLDALKLSASRLTLRSVLTYAKRYAGRNNSRVGSRIACI